LVYRSLFMNIIALEEMKVKGKEGVRGEGEGSRGEG
jgi:hypothetical protein